LNPSHIDLEILIILKIDFHFILLFLTLACTNNHFILNFFFQILTFMILKTLYHFMILKTLYHAILFYKIFEQDPYYWAEGKVIHQLKDQVLLTIVLMESELKCPSLPASNTKYLINI